MAVRVMGIPGADHAIPGRMADIYAAAVKPAAPEVAPSDAPVAPVPVEAPEALERKLEQADFQARFDDIMSEVNRHAKKGNARAGAKSAKEAYVDQETDSYELQKFGKLILAAEHVRMESARASALETRDVLTEAERAALKQSKRWVCAYNQLLGSLVEANEEALPRRRLEVWLKEAAHGDGEWAGRIMSGVAMEIATGKLLRLIPELEDVQHGDVDQDLMGQDYVFQPTPAGVSSVDAKVRMLGGAVMPAVRQGRSRVTINIAPKHIDWQGYQILPEYVEGYRKVLRAMLLEGKELSQELVDAPE